MVRIYGYLQNSFCFIMMPPNENVPYNKVAWSIHCWCAIYIYGHVFIIHSILTIYVIFLVFICDYMMHDNLSTYFLYAVILILACMKKQCIFSPTDTCVFFKKWYNKILPISMTYLWIICAWIINHPIL